MTENVESSSSDNFEEVKNEITAYNEMIETPHEKLLVIPTPLPQLDNISSESEVKKSEISLID